MSERVVENKELSIDWSKFKSNAKGKILEKAKQGYIEFCRMLAELDFELVSDYIGNKDKVELVYKLNDGIKFNMKPNGFKIQTYKTIICFKNNIIRKGDAFIKFAGLNGQGNLIAQIKTFDRGLVNIDVNNYNKWDNGRQDFYNKLREVGGYTNDYYINNREKINIFINNVKLNPVSPDRFKTNTYKIIIKIKEGLKENGDEFIKFTGLTKSGNLMVKIKTFDGKIIMVDTNTYNRFNNGRKGTYSYCEEKGYKILSPYISNSDKILIDFNCGHEPHWIIPAMLKQNYGCPICHESKGEKTIREYLEKNNIEFEQEYKFDNCKYKDFLRFDFYVPEYNLCVEFDGIQHFEAKDFFGGKETLKLTQKRDNIKNNYCKDNNINLLRIAYYDIDNIEKILDKELVDGLRELNNKIA